MKEQQLRFKNDQAAAERERRARGEELEKREAALNNQALNLAQQREALNMPDWTQKEKEMEARHQDETGKMKKEIQDQYVNIA